jgi:hypothetical protein
MNAALIAATTASAAAAAKARQNILDSFRLRGATAPDRARTLRELGLDRDMPALDALMKQGIVRGIDHRGRPAVHGEANGRYDGYFLDESAVVAHRDGAASRSQKQAGIVVVTIAAFLLAVLGAVLVLKS